MLKIAQRALNIAPSLTLAVTAKAKKLKDEGIDVVGFGAGEPDFNTPQYVIDAAKVALDLGMTKYTPSAGTVGLRQAICNKLLLDNNLKYTAKQIVVSNGAKQSLYNAFQAVIEEGDEVILPSPYWLTYPELITLCGGVVKAVETSASDAFKLTPMQLKQAITSKTKALVINSPSNPTGAVYSLAELQELASVLQGTDIWVISDEIYEKLVYGDKQHFSLASVSEDMYNRTITINGFSKAYSMTGWRVGYLAAPTVELSGAIDGIQSHETSNANSIAQYAAMVALSSGKDFILQMKQTFERRHKLIMELLKDVKLASAVNGYGAFYVMVDISKMFGKTYEGVIIKDGIHLSEILIEKALIAVIPCKPFGADNYIRLSYAISDESITKGIIRLKEFAEKLK